MSGLINSLLWEHFKAQGIDITIPPNKLRSDDKQYPIDTPLKKKLEPKTPNPKKARQPGFYGEKVIENAMREDYGTCKKHGTPLTAGGKCLQKGH